MPNTMEFIADRLPRVTVDEVHRFADTVEIRDAAAFAAELEVFMQERLERVELPASLEAAIVRRGPREAGPRPADCSISRACSRVRVVMSAPPSMRASSSMRASPSTGSIDVRVVPPCVLLLTRSCRPACEATCARCVTHSTCPAEASALSCRPTISATAPPTPASTSSKTRHCRWAALSVATCRARLMRDSSPPEAVPARGRGGWPGFALTMNSISSRPCSE